MNFLFLITARGGSKGIPKKNIKELCNKPLLHYSIEIAREFVNDDSICLSTDDQEIINCANHIGLEAPFIRPNELASDTAGSAEVIMHALNFYKNQGKIFDGIILLQPTSPLRLKKHIEEAIKLFNLNEDMVIAVKETKTNPYNLLFEKDSNGHLQKVLDSKNYTRRQDTPTVYEVNGAIYIYNTTSLINKSISEFSKTPYVMPVENSVDIDTPIDWQWTEFLLTNNIVKLDY